LTALNEVLKDYKSSYKRERAQKAQVAGQAAEEGKEPLTKKGYEYLMKKFVDINYTTIDQMDWVPLAACTARNTVMRRTFSGGTGFKMFRKKSDHILIFYPRDKGDPSKKPIPRSVYSGTNPW
jgi:1,2-phenylacetyl-CoA epoxidase PaaB subunit